MWLLLQGWLFRNVLTLLGWLAAAAAVAAVLDRLDVDAVLPDPMNLGKVHVSDDPRGPVESHQPKSAPIALLRISFQSVGDPPDDGGLADPGYARQQQDAAGNHSALLGRLRIEGRESPCDLFAFAFRALRFGRLVLGDTLALLEDLATGFAPIFIRRHGPLPTCSV
jgi:hypothetical protein